MFSNRNPSPAIASPESMSSRSPRRTADSKSEHLDRIGLGIVLAVGILLMLVSAFARGQESSGTTASRTDRFSAQLPKGSTLRIDNISGDVFASSGRQFAAVVTTTVTARSGARANEILRSTGIAQSREGDEYRLETRWPEDIGFDSSRRWPSWTRRMNRCLDCKITSRYELTVPPGVAALVHTVNGEVRIKELDGKLELASVNGDVVVSGSRSSVAAQSVNGRVEVAAQAALAGSSLRLSTVNGAVTLVLPRDAKFSLTASTMNGSIASTFPLPAAEEPVLTDETPAVRPPSPPRTPRRIVVRTDGEDSELDLKELERELDETFKTIEIETREVARQVHRLKIADPRREYTGAIGQGGASVWLSTLNGSAVLLAAGTREADAKPLVSKRRSFTVTVPRLDVNVKAPRVRVVPLPRMHPHVDVEEPEEVVRGDVSGDFLATTGSGGYRIGKVAGRVKILTHSGEIHVASAGSGADVKTFGGDVVIGSVTGDLRAQTMAGDIRCRTISGSASAETSGGDIRIDRVDGSAQARTAGGDIVLPAVGGSVTAETGGGEVRVAVVSREVKGGVGIHNSGGDVILTLPADFRGELDLTVEGSGNDEETMIRSDFPEITLTRRAGVQRGTGSLNGGGPRVTVRTASGEIHLRKSPAVSR